jgi:hypothetical protein
MKVKATSLFLGFCVAIMAVAAIPAYARSTTAFSGFHVEGPTGSDPYTCLTERNGAVSNGCTYVVSLEFNLPIDYPGSKSIRVQNGWWPTNPDQSYSCTSYAYTGRSDTSNVGTTITFTAAGQEKTTTVNVNNGATSIQVICWYVRPGGGVANFNWNP